MKIKLVTFFSFLIIASACTVKTIPLKGKYLSPPYVIESSNNFQNVWDKIIDLFAQKGIGIKLIDKSSGLIVAQNSLVTVTKEDKNGKPIDPEAWLVSSQMYEPGSQKYYYPEKASAEWNIRIKDLGNGKTSINVNLVNIVALTTVTQVNPIFMASTSTTYNTNVVSTGMFEKLLADLIK